MEPSPSEPRRVGPWTLDRLLGQGGMARVYRAVGEDGGVVALKWLHRASPGLLARFEEEVRLLERLDHPHVVRYRAHGVQDGLPWVAMRYVEGQDLRHYAEKLRQRPPAERQQRVRAIARELCEALAYVHALGVVHRDVKPSNVLLDVTGGVVLTDFGVACADDEPVTGMGLLVGTAAYAAPEQIVGRRVDARADQYGLGCTLYFLLTGRRPFDEADTAAMLHAHLERAPRPPSERDPTVAPDLEAFVLRLLAKEPEARFHDLNEARAALSAEAPEGMPLAGRQRVIDGIVAALDRVAAGEGVVLRLVGHRGSGRSWFGALARESADRRGLVCVVTSDPAALDAARRRVEAGEAVLVVTAAAAAGATEIEVRPLTIADLRRSVYALAPRTPDLAQTAERLHRETGGNAAMLLELLGRHVVDGRLVLPEVVTVDASRFTDGLDLDEEAVAGALAVLDLPASLSELQEVAMVPPEQALQGLEERGVAASVGGRWVLAAEALRAPLRALVPDLEGVEARARQLAPAAPETPADTELERAEPSALETLVRTATPAQRPARVVRWAESLHARGETARAHVLFEEALVTADPGLQRRARLGVGVTALHAGALNHALDRLTECVTDAELVGDGATAVLGLVHIAEARALGGELAEGLRVARRAVAVAEGLRDRALECRAVRQLGVNLLDAGMAAEAGRALADASALARAADLADERVLAQVLRARATLEEQPDHRTNAAAAIDRVLPQLGGTAEPAEARLLARCVWAAGAAVLGDGRMFDRAVAEADAIVVVGRIPLWLRAELLLARAAIAAGRPDAARDRAGRARLEARARGMRLLCWEAERIVARVAAAPLPTVGELAIGLDPTAVAALQRR